MPRLTQLLAVCTGVLVVGWLWAWIGLQWTLPIPAPAVAANPSREVDIALPTSPAASGVAVIKSEALLQQPAFYQDRRPHRFRPDDPDTTKPPAATLDFIVSSTVVGRRKSFAMLRSGGGKTVIARAGEPFEADPAWRVTRIDRTTVNFTSPQGEPLTLTIAPPKPGQAPVYAAASPVQVPAVAAPSASFIQAPPPVAIAQPVQDNAALRARIEARRKAAADLANSTRKD